MLRDKTWLIDLTLALLFFAYSIGRVVSALPALHKPRELADTIAYLRISNEPLLSPDFWASTRPLVFPLLLKIAHQDVRLAAYLQVGISIIAWGLLAWLVTRFVRASLLRPLTFGLILAFSLDRHIAGWDFVMMSESLSVSFFILFSVMGLWLIQEWQVGKAILLCLAGLVLSFTRDTNAWLLFLLAGIMTLAVLLRWAQTRALVLAGAFTITFLLSYAASNAGNRWVFPLGNLIGRRVLPDEAAVQYFRSCGMPTSPALMRLLGEFANAEERAMFADPELEPFREWLMEDGKACYTRWLIADPARAFSETLRQFDGLIAFPNVDKYFARAYDPLMPVSLGKFLYPERSSLWIWSLCTLATLLAVWKQSWRSQPLWAIAIYLDVLVLPHLLLAWHGDAMAPERHALSVGVQLYLAFWMLAILLVESLWQIKPEADRPARRPKTLDISGDP